MHTKRLTRLALLTAIALSIYFVEAQLPALVPIPGVKLGLANIITVYAMFACGAKDTLLILLCRILLGNLFTGQFVSFLYSFCGGMACYGVMLLLHRFLSVNQMWICSVLGSVAHVLGQMGAALVLTGTMAILYYLPVLIVSAILTGLFTGLCAQTVLHRFRK